MSMCIADLRIETRLQAQMTVVAIGADGLSPSIDLRRAYMVTGLTQSGTFGLVYMSRSGVQMDVPVDTTLATTQAGVRVYSHRCYSALPPGAVRVAGNAGDTCEVVVYEYDAAVDLAVLTYPIGRV